MSPKITFVEMDFIPLCPHCECELRELAQKSKFWSNQNVLACPKCHKLLGLSNVG